MESRPRPELTPTDRLLRLLAAPTEGERLSLRDWEDVVRVARHSRLLAILFHRCQAAGVCGRIPPQPRGHLEAAANLARYRAQMMRFELRQLAAALSRLHVRVILLKGAAYLAQDLQMAAGRMPGDVDLMVSRDYLAQAERTLLDAGWESQVSNDYDQRYYREWSHELPPLRFPGHILEVDLHHSITPVTGRLKPDPTLLFQDAIALPGSPWSVLAPPDQVLHAAVHLFQDSDLALRLHDLVDFDRLVRHHCDAESSWNALRSRAELLGLERPLWYALHFSAELLQTPVRIRSDLSAPPKPAREFMERVTLAALLPTDSDAPLGVGVRIARRLALARYHWLRMPPRLLVPHLARKALRAVTEHFQA